MLVTIVVAAEGTYPDWLGGSQRWASDSTLQLARRGHRTVLVTRSWNSSIEGVRNAFPGIEVRDVRGGAENSVRGRDLALRGILKRLDVGELPADAVCIGHHVLLTYALLRRYRFNRVVVVFHASAAAERRQELLVKGKLTATARTEIASLKRIEQFVLRRADAIVVLSKFSREVLAEEYGSELCKRVFLIPGGVDCGTLAQYAAVEASRKHLLTARRLDWRMGLENLITGFAICRDAYPEAVLRIAGSGPLDGQLRALAKQLAVGDRIEFRGRVSDAGLRRLYGESSIFVLPTTHYEGFGLATAEAMAAGCIPIGTRVGATPELIGPIDESLLVDSSSLAIGLKIEEVLGFPAEKRRRLRRRAQEIAGSWDWRVVADRVAEVCGL